MSRKLFDTKKVELDKHNVNGRESEKERKIILYCHQQSTLNSSHKKEREKLYHSKQKIEKKNCAVEQLHLIT